SESFNFLADRPDRPHVFVDRPEILLSHPGEHGPRHDRIEIAAADGVRFVCGGIVCLEAPDESLLRHVADARLLIGRDVGRADDTAVRQSELEAAGEGHFSRAGALLYFRMTFETERRPGHILPIRDRV